MRRVIVTLSSVLVAVGAACQWIVPLEDLYEGGPDAALDAATPDAGAEDVRRRPSACDDPASLPASSDPPSSRNLTLEFALSYVTFNAKNARDENDASIDLCETAAFDLDRRATCFDDGGRQHARAECAQVDGVTCAGPSCRSKAVVCDESEKGQDNSLGELVGAVAASAVGARVTGLELPLFLRTGEGNILMRVSDYNGEADDQHVTVTFYRSSGLVRDSALLVEAGGDDADERKWDGHSLREWLVDPVSTGFGGTSKGPPAQGRVVNHVLVAQGDEASFPGSLEVSVRDLTMMAELRPASDGRWALVKGRLGGFLSVSDLMRGVAFLPVGGPSGTEALCRMANDPRSAIEAYVCDRLDLSEDGGATCDAVSAGLAFTAVPAVIGPIRSPPYRKPIECPDIPDACPPP